MRTSDRPALAVLLSCEHASRSVPARYAPLFAGREALLASHRAWDPGALGLARAFARSFRAPIFSGRATRLLVDLNRSRGHRALFSELTRGSGQRERDRMLAEHYLPYRQSVERAVVRALARSGRVLHLSVHSFTPVLHGRRREVDIGLLYDPARAREQAFARAWQSAIAIRAPRLRVRRNQPYRGTSDGFTTALRKRYSERSYLGLELELSQGMLDRRSGFPRELVRLLLESLGEVLARETKPVQRRVTSSA